VLEFTLEGLERIAPELVEPAAQFADAVWVDRIDAARALGDVGDQSLSAFRCWDTAGRLTGKVRATSPTEAGPSRSRSNTARRVGSARAASVCP